MRAGPKPQRRRALLRAAVFLATALSPSLAFASPDRSAIAAIVSDPRGVAAPGCAVGVFQNGRTTFAEGGAIDLATGRQANLDTQFYAGSVAKQFTALAVVQLVVAGKLRLDQDIRTVLPQMRRAGPPITVEMLLHHTAGIPNSAKLEALMGLEHTGDASSREVFAALLNQPDTAFPPGTTFEYSNGGYLLLSLIVERVSGAPFADYVRRAILAPLGMTRSFVMNGPPAFDPNRAHGYVPKGEGFALSEDLPTFGGAGAMMLTIGDLAKYHHDIVAGHRVWTPAVTQLMLKEARYADDSPVIMPIPGYFFGYASGLMLSHDWVLHGGNYAGYQSLIAWRPAGGEGVALLCNRGDLKTPPLADRIVALVDPTLPPVDAARHSLPPVAGRFVSDALAVTYVLAANGDDLRATVLAPDGRERSTRALHRSGEGVYAAGPLTLTFDPDHRGFRIANGATAVRFRRVP